MKRFSKVDKKTSLKMSLIYLFSFLFISFNYAQNNNGYNLLWKIEGNGLAHPSYLFGTMHVKDIRAFNFSDSTMVSIEKCAAFAMEIHPDTLLKEMFSNIFSDDTVRSLKNILSAEEYLKLEKRFEEENGYSIDKLNLKNPLLIKQMLNTRKSDPADKQTFVDAYLYGIAKTMGKNIYGLEKVKDQMGFFNVNTRNNQREEIVDLINTDAKTSSDYLEDLIMLYNKGNIFEIEQKTKTGGYNDSLLIVRNKNMVKNMISIMRDHALFTAVGVAHLPGKDGIIDLLKRKGYKLTPVPASFTGISNKYTIDYTKMKWKTFTDSLTGYSVEAPGELMPTNIYEGLNTVLYTDLTNGVNYGAYTIDMQNSKTGFKENDLINKIIMNYKKNQKVEILKSKKINRDGFGVTELIINTHSSTYLRIQLTARNNILYCLFVGNKLDQIKEPYADRFFNSFKAFKPTKSKDPKWIDFSVDKGAFSIQLPVEPKPIVKEVANPGKGNDDPYLINMYMSTDISNMTNYLVRFNDYPIGSYLGNKAAFFNAFMDDLKRTNKMLAPPDTIWQDGYEGRSFKMMLLNKYYTTGKLFVRGNRTYLLMKQNLNENVMELKDDNFFNSFTFEPYLKTNKYTYKPKDESFEIQFPSPPKVMVDSTINYKSRYCTIIDCYSTNHNSGGSYQFEYSDFNEFFKIKNLDNFYNDFIEKLNGYSDSVISSDSVMVDGIYGREYVLYKWKADNPQRARIWIYNDHLFYETSYIGKDELFNEESNMIFNSFKASKKQNTFDIYSSKTEKILTGLQSADSAVYHKALGALTFYDFTSDDLPKVFTALNWSYKDDAFSTGARCSLIKAIGKVNDPSAIDGLEKLYTSVQNNDEIKVAILNSIVKANPTKGLPVYLRLLKTGKIIKLNKDDWKIFQPLRDSTYYAANNFEALVTFIDSSEYRDNILAIASDIVNSDSIKDNFLKKYFYNLTKYALKDINAFKINSEKNRSEYYFQSDIYSYLTLMNAFKDKELVNNFTNELFKTKCASFMITSGITARIKNNLEIDKKVIAFQMKDLSSRYQILKTYYKMNQLEKVPAKYTNQQEFARLCFYNYLANDDESPDKLDLLGTIVHDDALVYVYCYSYITEEKDKLKYIGISGPYPKNYKINFDSFNSFYNWTEKKDDWKKQATELIGLSKEQ